MSKMSVLLIIIMTSHSLFFHIIETRARRAGNAVGATSGSCSSVCKNMCAGP